MKFEDFKPGDLIQHIHKGIERRVGVIESCRNDQVVFGRFYTEEGSTAYLFCKEDVKNVTLLTKSEYPEYFL